MSAIVHYSASELHFSVVYLVVFIPRDGTLLLELLHLPSINLYNDYTADHTG